MNDATWLSAADTEPPTSPRLSGDLVIWLLILAELLTFGIFFMA